MTIVGGVAGRVATAQLRAFHRQQPPGSSLAGRRPPGRAAQRLSIRADFPAAPLAGPGWIAVGETAGLVSPVSGDGIDLALESGQIAADHVRELLPGPAPTRLGWAYARALRQRYGAAFQRMRGLRDLVLRPGVAEMILRLASRLDGLTESVIRQALGVSARPLR